MLGYIDRCADHLCPAAKNDGGRGGFKQAVFEYPEVHWGLLNLGLWAVGADTDTADTATRGVVVRSLVDDESAESAHKGYG